MCWATVTTPFGEDGEVDEAALRSNLRAYAAHFSADYPIGFVACGTYGESLSMTDAERRTVIEATVEEAGQDVPVIAALLSGDNCLARTIELARHCESVGVDAICLAPPTYYFKPSLAGIAGWLSWIGCQLQVPLVLYNLAGRLGYYLEPSDIEHLAQEIPTLAGMKLSAPSLEMRAEMIERVGKAIAVIEGAEAFAPDSLPIGATGYMASSAVFAPGLMSEWSRSIFGNNTGKLASFQGRVARYRRLQSNTAAEPPALLKAAMDCVGLIGGPVRLPLTPLSDEDEHELRESLQEMGVPVAPQGVLGPSNRAGAGINRERRTK